MDKKSKKFTNKKTGYPCNCSNRRPIVCTSSIACGIIAHSGCNAIFHKCDNGDIDGHKKYEAAIIQNIYTEDCPNGTECDRKIVIGLVVTKVNNNTQIYVITECLFRHVENIFSIKYESLRNIGRLVFIKYSNGIKFDDYEKIFQYLVPTYIKKDELITKPLIINTMKYSMEKLLPSPVKVLAPTLTPKLQPLTHTELLKKFIIYLDGSDISNVMEKCTNLHNASVVYLNRLVSEENRLTAEIKSHTEMIIHSEDVKTLLVEEIKNSQTQLKTELTEVLGKFKNTFKL